MKDVNKIIGWALVACVVIIIILSITTCNSYKSAGLLENNLLALNDTVRYFKDENGKTVAVKRELELSNKTLLKLNAQKDSMLLSLQKWVKENGKSTSATAVKIKTVYVGGGNTIVRDTFEKSIYPTYFFQNTDEHVSLMMEMGYDTTVWEVSFTDEVIVSHEYVKDGFFKRKYPVIKVTSNNPYSSIKDIASYRVPLKKQIGISVGPMVGYGVSVPDFKPNVFLGVGVTYSVIKF